LGFLGNSFLKNESAGNKTLANPKPIKSVREIISEKKSNEKFENIKLFDFKNPDMKSGDLNKYMKSFTLLNLKKDNLLSLLNSQKENIVLDIPLSEKTSINLELIKIPVLADNFEVKVITKDGIVPYDYKPGVYYRGIVKDNPNSAVAISIFENSVIGIISDETGNYNLGVLKDDKSGESYIYYNERDLLVKNKFKCGVDDFGKMRIKNNKHTTNNIETDNPSARLPVSIYFVADYQMYMDNSSNVENVKNYITSVFNEVSTIYQNDFLHIQLASIYVYATADPYRNLHDPLVILQKFGENTKDNFTGHLAHLLSTRNENFGGISWINTLCTNYNAYDQSGPYSFSGIENDYNPFPTYSWTVMVIAHEMGHSFGSMHTHACVWPITSNTIGQIDSCYTSEESCTSIVEPINNGTVMSYCHLQGAIDLYLGFGSMPGDTVRLRYNQGACFGPVINSSEFPTNFQLDQNHPNPFNPATTISFAVPQDAFITIKVYDVMGREIAEVINNKFFSRGYQSVMFNSAQYNLSSGIYFYKLVASSSGTGNIFTQVKKMILLK
ncbi:MAG: M12 family metallo-peptidase, partial [Ignavibacteriae bacterium]|nr:M12 family metallo-peptidase [Ignavibacteriota bacterium]